jgi:hypothetical protein
MSATTEPASVTAGLADSNWRKEMAIEYDALLKNKT